MFELIVDNTSRIKKNRQLCEWYLGSKSDFKQGLTNSLSILFVNASLTCYIRWSNPPTKIVRIASKFALVQLIKTEKLYVNLVVYDLIERNSKVEEIPRVLLQLKALTWLKALWLPESTGLVRVYLKIKHSDLAWLRVYFKNKSTLTWPDESTWK